ncbi:MAG: bifunctional alpha,alpha-trehalose-phosphate synthase (UDP-forming)/trehalose-phosphatase [Sedimentisphaerales bacterium]|nr:bifunctional alpha,alpha-trehalose-phosphate synthase (UDP-forming)/trehalose-phosphatase [Sedimentisphaerales bacterium]
MQKLITVSNRLPFSIYKGKNGITFKSSAGGLATALTSASDNYQTQWIGWPGISTERTNQVERQYITEELNSNNCHPVFISKKQIKLFYEGFSNSTIWPLFHYFTGNTIYEERFWSSYKRVNQTYCQKVLECAGENDFVWIHDYQLMLLPHLIRKKMPNMKIGFFLHIPFPSFEIFRLLPWRQEILDGILGADLIGFHAYDYARHFLSSICRLKGVEHNLGIINIGKRIIKVDAFPIGIDYDKYAQSGTQDNVKEEIEKIRKTVGDRKIIISIDRLDYTKGIIRRLEAFDLFISQNPEYRNKVTLILVAVPSRSDVKDYQSMRTSLEQLVSRVNGAHAVFGWIPVWYLYRSLPFEQITALYNVADVALVTPMRDGMNLIAKEYVAAKENSPGVLILSEMAGAASELGEALIVNPTNKTELVKAVKTALDMPPDEQSAALKPMQNRIKRYNITRWVSDFVNAMNNIKELQSELIMKKLSEKTHSKLIKDYTTASRRLLLLDYDGTLVGFKNKPEMAGPDPEIIELLRKLSEIDKNHLVIISGRDKNTLLKWLGGLDIIIVAEHGAWIKLKKDDFKCMVEHQHTEWKDTLRPILELYADRTPGALVEEKDFSLVWHCRRSEPELAQIRAQELRSTLHDMTSNLGVGVFEGSKIIEVKPHEVNKGRAVEAVLENNTFDFILAAGDDYTDEEMFKALPDGAYSVKVGFGPSKAKYHIDSVNDFRTLLQNLTRSRHAET